MSLNERMELLKRLSDDYHATVVGAAEAKADFKLAEARAFGRDSLANCDTWA